MQPKSGPLAYSSLSGGILSFTINCLILYYILGLEKEHCKCTRDEYHNLLKYLTIFNIGWPVIGIIISLLLVMIFNMNIVFMVWFTIVIVYTFALFCGAIVLFRYIGSLDHEDCVCAEKDMYALHTFLKIWRWIQLILSSIALVLVFGGGIYLIKYIKTSKK